MPGKHALYDFFEQFPPQPFTYCKTCNKSVYAARTARKNMKYMPEKTANKTIAVCFGAT